MRGNRVAACAAMAAVLACGTGVAAAQAFPTKPVRVITPTAAGGSLDTIARTVGQKLAEVWSQQVIVDNRAGAGGMLGCEAAARSPADGYTLLFASNGNLATTQALYRKVPYDPVKDFTTVELMAETPYIIVVHASMPVKTVADFIAFAKARPGQINYASSGNGSTPHLAVELFQIMSGVKLVHVPYKGSPAALNSLVSGETAFKITGLPLSYPHVKAGRIRALAVASEKRVASAPEIPTATESGLPGYVANSWAGLLVPAGTPPAVVAKLNADVTALIARPDMRQLMSAQGFEVLGSTPEQFAAFLKAEIAKWSEVIRVAKARVG